MRYFLARHRQEVVEEFEQTHGFVVLFFLPLHLKQQGFCVHFEYGKFIQQGGVKDFIRLFLEGEDIVFFATTDGWPAGDRLPGIGAAGAIVADDSSEQTAVGGGDAVVLIYV